MIFKHWEDTVRRKCEYGFFHITNAKKYCQITSRRRVIWWVFGMSDVEKPILTHIFDLTVFTLLKTTISQNWQFFWKICQIVVKCVHEFYCHFVKCVHWSLFNSFFTIVVFNNVQWSFSQLFQSLFCYFGIVRFILFHLFLIFLSKIDSTFVNIRSLNLFPIEHIECNNSIGSTPVGKFDIKSR